MDLNNKLKELYLSKWNYFIEKRQNVRLQNHDFTRPLLLEVSDSKKYLDSNIKYMLFGQETYGWCEGGNFGQITDLSGIVGTMNGYKEFFNNGNPKRSSPFWNEAKSLYQQLKKILKNENINFIHNNIVKIGRASGSGLPSRDVLKLEMETFNVVKKEIEILLPNFMIFFTGPNYDKYIENKLGKFTLKEIGYFNTNQMSYLFFENKDLPPAIRLYHPRFIYRKGSAFKEIYYKTFYIELSKLLQTTKN